MNQSHIFWTALGMGLATYFSRAMPIWALQRRRLPPWLQEWLGLVPGAVMAALLCPAVFLHKQSFSLGFDNLFFWVTLPTMWVALRTRNFVGTIVAGSAMIALVRYVSLV